MLSGPAKVAYHRRMNQPLVSYKNFEICPVTKNPAQETSIINNMIIKTCNKECAENIKEGLKSGVYNVKNSKLYKLEQDGMKFVQSVKYIVDDSYGVKEPHMDNCSCYICVNTND